MNPPVTNAKDDPIFATYGYPEEWSDFSLRHQEFLKRSENIWKAIDTAFRRSHEHLELLGKVTYFQGRLVVEEFMEILLLCGNGYGIAAQKILRGMYERAVTSRYLTTHPEEVQNFLDYHKVTSHKVLSAIEQSVPQDLFTPQHAAQIRAEYDAVKGHFLISDCKTCETFRLNHTWSQVDIVSMARKTKNLWPLIVPGYYLPMTEAHSTTGAIFARIDFESLDANGLAFVPEAQRDRADKVLPVAHVVLLDALQLQREFFKIEALEPLLQTCMHDYSEIWKD
jgi:hypothetical protein